MQPRPLPRQFRQTIPSGKKFFELTETLRAEKLNTVCEEAKCPNRSDCYARGTLTFQILGDRCTRRCGFCAEKTAVPEAVDASEPQRILRAAQKLKLRHIVVTAPARDDLADGGAEQFAKTVTLLKRELPHATVEILISDLEDNRAALQTVLDSRPDVFNHNAETVRRLTPHVRAKATYDRSLQILKRVSQVENGPKVKSGIMLGLGETWVETFQTLADMKAAGVQYLTLGQYLQPSPKHLPVEKYYTPAEFAELRDIALRCGFDQVFAGPLVRSSYHADEMAGAAV